MDKAWAGVLLPTIALGFFAVIPYIDRSREAQGVWFGTKYAGRLTVVAALYALVVSAGLVVFDAGDRTHTEYLTRWIGSCPAEEAQVEHQGWPCLVDEGGEHQGIITTNDLATRMHASVPFPHVLGVNDGHLDWPEDVEHVPVPINICGSIGIPDGVQGIGGSSLHLWCDYHLNFPAIITQQVIPLVIIVAAALAIIFVLFRIGWLRTKRDLFIVMFTSVMTAYLVLSMVGSFFRGQGQALIWPWEIKVDEG
jgi:hypothetical protein